MDLKKLWSKNTYDFFTLSDLPVEIRKKGTVVTYPPRSVIINRGDFPEHIYFLESGTALGTREYTDGNNYYYFKITKENGALGLLEVLSHKPRSVATVVASTEVRVLKIKSSVVYDFILKDKKSLFDCLYTVANDLYYRSGNDGILYYQRGLDRVRYYLIQYYDTHEKVDGRVYVVSDYQTIAANIGVSVRTVVRGMAKLKEQGEVTSFKKKLSVSKEQYDIMLASVLPLLSK